MIFLSILVEIEELKEDRSLDEILGYFSI